MLNFNLYREKALYEETVEDDSEVSGDDAYERYGRISGREVLRRGGRPIWMGSTLRVLVGDRDERISQPWADVILAYYPTRMAFLDMLASPEYQSGSHHRTAAIEDALLFPGTPRPAFDPGR